MVNPAPSAASGLGDDEEIRARFEKWAARQNLVLKRKGGSYASTYGAWCWEAFYAATMTAPARSHQAPVGEGQNALLREIRDNLKWSSIPYEQELHARIDRALKTPSPQTGGGS